MTTEREKQLEEVLAKFLEPVKGIPFEIVIKSLCGKEVIKFDRELDANKKLLEALIEALTDACTTVQAKPISRYRPNEVGNDMEPYVADALTRKGIRTAPAKTKSGQGKATAYPDLLIEGQQAPIYLEVKSYAAENHETTQRSFYLSPSEDPKVAFDAYHLVVGFEILDKGGNGSKDDRNRDLRDYVPVAFTLADLYGMNCDMKAEFNSDNRRMYEVHRVLAKVRV